MTIASMTDNTFTLANIEAHPELFIGPNAASLFVQATETGLIVSQALHFIGHSKHESGWIKLIVAFVTAVAL